MYLEPTCVWRITPEIISALQERFGDPIDAYVNGSQVWLLDNGPNEVTLQWRLHPVAGYVRPANLDTYAVFSTTAFAIANQEPLPASLDVLWDGLEVWPAYSNEDKVEVNALTQAAESALGISPGATGSVNHKAIGDAWENSGRSISIVEMLFQQLLPAVD